MAGELFSFELSCASITAIVSNTGGLEYPKSYVLCYVNGQHGTTFQMQMFRPRQRRHRDPRPATGTQAAAAAAAAAAAVTPPPLHGCSVHDCFGGLSGCGPLPQHRPRGKAVNGFRLHWCAFRSLLFGSFHVNQRGPAGCKPGQPARGMYSPVPV